MAESVKRPDYYDYDYLDYVSGNVRDELGSPVNDLSHISNITTALLNTANRKDFHAVHAGTFGPLGNADILLERQPLL